MNTDRNQRKNEKSMAAFLQEAKVPDMVQEKVNETLCEIRREGVKAARRQRAYNSRKQAFYLPKTAVIAVSCFLVLGATAVATEIGSLYRQRMENMSHESIEGYYEIANAGETTLYNRPLTEEEKARYQQLKEAYEKNGVFPKSQVTSLQEGEAYSGKGVAVDELTSTLYLPGEALSDEEMLQMIDFQHKIAYSIYAKQQERIMQGGNWESRMAEMTDEMVDRIYLAYCASNLDVGGGYSRELTEAEQQHYDAMVTAYEDEGKYAETEIPVIQAPEEYTGSGVAFCASDSKYYLPKEELTEGELLQIIDFEHKIPYCFDRIHSEIDMGLRTGYPEASGDNSRMLTEEEMRRIE